MDPECVSSKSVEEDSSAFGPASHLLTFPQLTRSGAANARRLISNIIDRD
jgi:hypothetical protein